MNDPLILNDSDVRRLLTVTEAAEVMERALHHKARGTLIAPPRFHVSSELGALVFATGGLEGELLGFRVYNTFSGDSPKCTQVVAVFSARDGGLEGLILGDALGALRTGAVGGVAVKYLASSDARTVGVLGSGLQARAQLLATAAVRTLEQVKVYSRDESKRRVFASEMTGVLGTPVHPVSSARAAVSEVDILLVATSSSVPVFEAVWLSPGTHVNSLGPKFQERHELPLELASRSALITTDSRAQVEGYGLPFFLHDTPEMQHLTDLSEIVAGRVAGRQSPDDITLFCSVGLAGTEVLLGHEVLQRAR